jgi:hypothetical protein
MNTREKSLKATGMIFGLDKSSLKREKMKVIIIVENSHPA